MTTTFKLTAERVVSAAMISFLYSLTAWSKTGTSAMSESLKTWTLFRTVCKCMLISTERKKARHGMM
jgi:hypothetical protein